jgi:hypothetical protein
VSGAYVNWVQRLAHIVSGAYVNSLLVQRDSLLAKSSLQAAFKSWLRSVPVSPLSLFGDCAKAAVDESAKRTTDLAFASIARQGKRPQAFSAQPAKLFRALGFFPDRKGPPPAKASGRGSGRRRFPFCQQAVKGGKPP